MIAVIKVLVVLGLMDQHHFRLLRVLEQVVEDDHQREFRYDDASDQAELDRGEGSWQRHDLQVRVHQ